MSMKMNIKSLILCFVILSLFSKHILSSQGVFEIHIKNYILNQSLDLAKCCPDAEPMNGNCAGQCNIFMEICLSIYQKNPRRYVCDIGENTIITDILGNANLSSFNNSDYFIKVRERWKKNFNILVKIKHRDVKTKREKILVTLSSAEENVRPSKDWITKSLSTPEDQFQLFVSFRYSCSKYHYGEMCDKYCKPNHSGTGHYNCTMHGEIQCHSGYSGTYCDKVVCQTKCLHGTCIGPNLCRCSNGWTGKSCEKCTPYPGCVNGACRQVDNSTDLLPLTCDCQKGWGGMFCNIDLNYCSNNLNVCLNGGECQNFGNINTNQQYRCLCKPGYSGAHCEKSVTNCEVRGCLNGGICEVNISKCLCKESFYGDQCQFNMTSCNEVPCIGSNSKCYSDTKFGFKCECAIGFGGRNCEIDNDECSTNPCLNGGMCIDRASGFRCVCPVGFSGNRCQVNKNDCQRLSCMNGAKCIDRANRIDCECRAGWTGGICNQNINECASNQPCLHGGVCEDTLGSYTCTCPSSWVGEHCQMKFPGNDTHKHGRKCPINPCGNNGLCFLLSGRERSVKEIFRATGGEYHCVCPPGFVGRLCQHVIIANGSLSTPFFVFESNKNHMTILNLVIIAIGIPGILVILTVISLIWCKSVKNFHKFESSSKYQSDSFKNNAAIKIFNNKLSQKEGNKVLLSAKKLNNLLRNNELSGQCPLPHLCLSTYKCSIMSISAGIFSSQDLPVPLNTNLFSLKSMNIDEEEDELNEKSASFYFDRDGEPETIYQNSNQFNEINKSNFKSSYDSNINGQKDSNSKTCLGYNSALLSRKKDGFIGHSLCSSQNSLVESAIDLNLRSAISQPFQHLTFSLPHKEKSTEFQGNIVNFTKFKQRQNRNCNIERGLQIVNYATSSEDPLNEDRRKLYSDNRYVFCYNRSIMPQRINYDLISNPNFKETSCFRDSSAISPTAAVDASLQ